MKSGQLALLMIFTVVISCDWFERQEHEIVNPEIPTFKVHGLVRKISNGQGVKGLELLLHQQESYDGGWKDQTIVYSQEDGYYEFTEVPRGKFTIFVYEDDETLTESVFGLIYYHDKEINISVPL